MANSDSVQPTAGHNPGHTAVLVPLGAHASAAPIPIKRPLTVIGSRKDIVKLHLDSSTVSKAHCAIVLSDWGCYVHDLNSRTHTWVNGQQVKDADLAHGDTLQIGRFQFRYVAPSVVQPKEDAVDGEVVVSTLTDPLPLTSRIIQIGRRSGSDLQFDDSRVSNIHALIFSCSGQWYVRDLGSRTGVWLGGKPVRQEMLDDGSLLKIGKATLTFRHRHLDDDFEDDRDRSAPLPLDKASARRAPGNDFASPPPAVDLAPPDLPPVDLTPIDLVEAQKSAAQELAARESTTLESVALESAALESVAMDSVAPDSNDVPADESTADDADAIPSADALASLRRGWRAPVTDESIPLEAQPNLPKIDPLKAEPAKARPPVPKPALAPLDEDAVADLLADADAVPEPIDLADLVAEPPALTPDQPGGHQPSPSADQAGWANKSTELPTPKPQPPELPDEDELFTVPAAEAEPVAPAGEMLADVASPAAAKAIESVPAEPIASAATAIPNIERTHEIDVADIDLDNIAPGGELQPLELDDLADLDVAAPVAEAPFPLDDAADDVTPVVEPAIAISTTPADLPAAEAPVWALSTEPIAATDPIALDLEPLALDEAAAAEAPAHEAPAHEALLDEAAAASVGGRAPEAGLALDPIDFAIFDDPAPLVLDEAAASLAAEPADVLEPVAEAKDVAVEAPMDEPALSEAGIAEADIAESEVAESQVAESQVAEFQIAEQPVAPSAEAPTDDVEVTADVEVEAYESPDVGQHVVAPPVELTLEAAEIEALGEEPQPIEELANVEFDLEPEPAAATEAAPDAISAAAVKDGPAAPPAVLSEAAAPETPAAARPVGTAARIAAFLAEKIPSREADPPAQPTAEISAPAPSAEAPAEIDFSAAGLQEENPFDFLDDEPALRLEMPAPPDTEAAPYERADAALDAEPPAPALTAEPVAAAPVFPPPPQQLPFIAPPAFDEASIEIIDDPEPVISLDDDDEIDNDLSDTAMALDLSAFIDADEDEHEWEDALPAPEPVMEVTVNENAADDAAQTPGDGEHDDAIETPQGGSLSDLIPQNPPLIGGMFTPEGPTMIGGSPVINFDAPPPPPKDTNGRRRPLRVGFNARSKNAASPFAAGQTNTIADALIGAGESVDVFASPSPSADELQAITGTPPTAEDDAPPLAPVDDDAVAAESFVETAVRQAEPQESPLGGKTEEQEIRAVADLFRPRVPVPPAAHGGVSSPFGQTPIAQPSTGQTPDPQSFAPQQDPKVAAQVRLSRYKRIIALLIATIPLASGGVFAVYRYVRPYSVIDSMITYDGLDRLGIEEARAFRSNQSDHLQSDRIRQKAILALPANVTNGFLGDPKLIDQVLDHDPAVRWPPEQPSVMRLRIQSTDKANDRTRLLALAQVLVAASDADTAQRDAVKKLVDNDQSNADHLKRREDEATATLQDLQQAGNSRPDLSQIAKLQDARKKAEADLTAVKSTRQELEASLQVLQRPESVPLSPQTQVDVAQSDQALAILSTQLTDLQKQSDADKAEAARRSAAARNTLDDSIAQFQKDLQGAQNQKQSPELAARVEAANHIFIQTRELTESLIRRQENQRTRLAELKSRLEEKIEASTRDRLEKDEELKKLHDELAIDTRQYNAAIGQGDIDDAKKLELTLALVRARIGGREDLAKNDPVNTVTADLQGIIEQTEQQIADDRKHVDETLLKVQDDFAKSAPDVDKLPDEQKALAEAVDKKLAAVNDARKAYDKAADDTQAAQLKIEQDQKAKASAIQLQIAARRQEVLDAAQAKASHDTEVARQEKLTATQQQLVTVRASEQVAQQALDGASNAIDTAEKQRRAFVDSDLLRNEKIEEKAAIEHDLKQVQASIAAHQAELVRLIVPDRKIEMASFDQPDRRPIYAAGVGGGLFALMMLPVFWTLMLTARDAHHGHAPPPASPEEPQAQGFEPVLAEPVEREGEPIESGRQSTF